MAKQDNSEERLRTLAAEQAMVNEADVKAESKLVEDLGMDSLDLVEFAINAEEEFGVVIPDSEAAKLVTFGDAVRLVDELVKQ